MAYAGASIVVHSRIQRHLWWGAHFDGTNSYRYSHRAPPIAQLLSMQGSTYTLPMGHIIEAHHINFHFYANYLQLSLAYNRLYPSNINFNFYSICTMNKPNLSIVGTFCTFSRMGFIHKSACFQWNMPRSHTCQFISANIKIHLSHAPLLQQILHLTYYITTFIRNWSTLKNVSMNRHNYVLLTYVFSNNDA